MDGSFSPIGKLRFREDTETVPGRKEASLFCGNKEGKGLFLEQRGASKSTEAGAEKGLAERCNHALGQTTALRRLILKARKKSAGGLPQRDS